MGGDDDDKKDEVVQQEPEDKPEQSHGAPDPLKGKSLKEICGMDGLALVKFSYDELHSDFAAKCCGPKGLDEDNERCSLDWPFSDVPSCDEYDRLREDMMAQYGFPFEGEVGERYAEKPWYEKRTDYKPEWLPIVVKKNAQKLKKLKEEKEGCE